MKKFLITLIYATLTILVVGYLFLTLNIGGFQNLSVAAFWLHIAAYIGYSFVVPQTDKRTVYPISLLLILVLVNVFEIPLNQYINNSAMSILVFILLTIYMAFHLLIKDYLGKNDMKILRKFSLIALLLFLLAGVFKIAQWPMVTELFILGVGSCGLLLLLTGVSKDLKRR